MLVGECGFVPVVEPFGKFVVIHVRLLAFKQVVQLVVYFHEKVVHMATNPYSSQVFLLLFRCERNLCLIRFVSHNTTCYRFPFGFYTYGDRSYETAFDPLLSLRILLLRTGIS